MTKGYEEKRERKGKKVIDIIERRNDCKEMRKIRKRQERVRKKLLT